MKEEILEKLNCLLKDFEMLRNGSWEPDNESIDCSIDNVLDVIEYVRKEEK